MNALAAHRILVVHPSTPFRDGLARELKRWGYRYVAVVSGAHAAFEKLEHGRVDLVIVGSSLEDMDVWSFAKTVRSGNLCPRVVPLLMIVENAVAASFETIAADLGVTLYRSEESRSFKSGVASCIAEQPSRTVLVIEDDPNVGEIVQAGLGPYYRVETALDGQTGLSRWRRRRHDIVLLDLELPRLPGEKVLERILLSEPRQAVIIITGHGTRERYKHVMLEGAADFVKKPFDIGKLRLVCDRVWRHAALAREALDARAVVNRVAAANQCLESGRVGLAHRIIRDALSIPHDQRPGSDALIRPSKDK